MLIFKSVRTYIPPRIAANIRFVLSASICRSERAASHPLTRCQKRGEVADTIRLIASPQVGGKE